MQTYNENEKKIIDANLFLASFDTDHASIRNGLGYNKSDGDIAHPILRKYGSGQKLDNSELRALYTIGARYARTQLKDKFDFRQIQKPEKVAKEHATPSAIRMGNSLALRFTGAKDFKLIKNAISEKYLGRFRDSDANDKFWQVAPNAENVAEFYELLERHSFEISEDSHELLAAIVSGELAEENAANYAAQRIVRKLHNGDFHAVCNQNEFQTLYPIFSGFKAFKTNEGWHIKKSKISQILELQKEHGFTVEESLIAEIEVEQKRQNEFFAQIAARTAKVHDYFGTIANGHFANLQIGGKRLFKHQIIGVKYLLGMGTDSLLTEPLYKRLGVKVLHLLEGKPFFKCLADRMGLGKTRQAALAAAIVRKALREDFMPSVRIIVVCPKSVRGDWHNEFKLIGETAEVYTWSNFPTEIEGDYIVIADECQKMKNPESIRSVAIRKLTKSDNCIAFYALSATPIRASRAENAYALFDGLCHPMAHNHSQFVRQFAGKKGNKKAKIENSDADDRRARLESLIVALLERGMLLQRKKEDCLDLPDKTYLLDKRDLDENDAAYYQAVIDRLKAEHEARMRAKNSSMSAGEILVAMNHARQASSHAKVNSTVEYVSGELDADETNKFVLFTEFRETAEAISSRLKNEGFEVVLMTGETSERERERIKNEFQTNGKVRVFITTTLTGGVGITLTAANYCLLHDFPWINDDMIQAFERIDRIGQTRFMTMINVLATSMDFSLYERIRFQAEGEEIMFGVSAREFNAESAARQVYEELIGSL